MTIRTKASLILLLLLCSLAYPPAPASASGSSISSPVALDLVTGTYSVKNNQPVALQELSIEGLVSLPIVRQPNGVSTFVSPLQDYLTEFQTATQYGSVGLLAHNDRAGQYFFQVLPGQKLSLVHSDGSARTFVVTEIQRYQALVPDSPSSDFIEVATGEYLSARQLFRKIYGTRTGQLILQTCIDAEGNPSWGRMFVIAVPVPETD